MYFLLYKGQEASIVRPRSDEVYTSFAVSKVDVVTCREADSEVYLNFGMTLEQRPIENNELYVERSLFTARKVFASFHKFPPRHNKPRPLSYLEKSPLSFSISSIR